jgi:hypothetical protein
VLSPCRPSSLRKSLDRGPHHRDVGCRVELLARCLPGPRRCVGHNFIGRSKLRVGFRHIFVSTESTFVDPEWIDNCIDPAGSPVIGDRALPVYIGCDASVKKDSTAIAAVCFDRSVNKVRLVAHRIFQPTQAEPLNFEATVERTVKELFNPAIDSTFDGPA